MLIEFGIIILTHPRLFYFIISIITIVLERERYAVRWRQNLKIIWTFYALYVAKTAERRVATDPEVVKFAATWGVFCNIHRNAIHNLCRYL